MLAYNLMIFAIVAVCLAAIHLAFDERQRKEMKRYFASLIASIKSSFSIMRLSMSALRLSFWLILYRPTRPRS